MTIEEYLELLNLAKMLDDKFTLFNWSEDQFNICYDRWLYLKDKFLEQYKLPPLITIP